MSLRSMALLALPIFVAACGSRTTDDPNTRRKVAGVGEPCTTSDEASTQFGGYDIDEIVIASDDPLDVCLVNHFQGRLGCPYGQTQDDLALSPGDPKRCRTPEGQAVSVPFPPQLAGRPVIDAVYRSCRCDGPDASATYCLCPAGFSCHHLIDSLGVKGSGYDGSYCVRAGTQFDSEASYGPSCDRAAGPGDSAYCG